MPKLLLFLVFLYDLPEYGKLRQNLLQTAFDRALRHAPRSVSERKFGARVAVFHDRVVFAAHAAVFAGEVYQALGVIPFKKAAKAAFGRLLFHKKTPFTFLFFGIVILYSAYCANSSFLAQIVVFFIHDNIQGSFEGAAARAKIIADRVSEDFRCQPKSN